MIVQWGPSRAVSRAGAWLPSRGLVLACWLIVGAPFVCASCSEAAQADADAAGAAGAASPPSGGGAGGRAAGAGAAGAPAGSRCVEDADASEQLRAPWDWVGVIGTGQSLAVGTTPILSKSQPYDNLMLSLGGVSVPPWDASNSGLEMVPLVERSTHTGYPAPYPENLWGETPHSSMASEVSYLVKCHQAERSFVTVHSIVGESGQGLVAIDKQSGETTGETGRAYAATLFEAEAITRLAADAGKRYGVGVIVMTHGETDSGSSTYKEGLVTLWNDYNTELSAITGQTEAIPMYLSQQHGYPNTGVGARPVANQTAYELGLEHPGDFVCTGPKYQYPGNDDGVHLTALGYQLLGEKTGQVYYEREVLGRDWQPLQPAAVDRGDKRVTVHFHVPVGPLRWDEGLAAPRVAEWANGRGFELKAGSARLEIESVAIVGDAVEIATRDALPATGLTVAYALSSQGAQMATASRAVRWGQLRDSDPFVGSTTDQANPNYALSFQLPVP